jgi:nucleotide sugar dehydrogenase
MTQVPTDIKVGFIGNGYVGKHIADDFEHRGLTVVRYALETPYDTNKDAVGACDIVIVAVPTPTTPEGFDGRIVEDVLAYVQSGKIVVIKSTVTPGTTKRLQEKYPDLTLLFSPEFLREANAADDAAHPFAVIVGMPVIDDVHERAAQLVLQIMPEASSRKICGSTEAEMMKYAQNVMGYVSIVFFNLLYEVNAAVGGDWQVVRELLSSDPNTASHFANPVHKGGRGAGGNCLIKDFAALREMYEKLIPQDTSALGLLRAMERKNLELLVSSGKTVDIARRVYGEAAITDMEKNVATLTH